MRIFVRRKQIEGGNADPKSRNTHTRLSLEDTDSLTSGADSSFLLIFPPWRSIERIRPVPKFVEWGAMVNVANVQQRVEEIGLSRGLNYRVLTWADEQIRFRGDCRLFSIWRNKKRDPRMDQMATQVLSGHARSHSRDATGGGGYEAESTVCVKVDLFRPSVRE